MKPHCLRILTKFTLFVKKFAKKNLWLFLFGFLALSLSFSLGFIIGGKIISRPPLIIDKQLIIDINENLTQKTMDKTPAKEFPFVASSRGKYYYPVNCRLADNLKEENKIYFKTQQEAEKRGYIYNTRCD